jgi:hypothetical protein
MFRALIDFGPSTLHSRIFLGGVYAAKLEREPFSPSQLVDDLLAGQAEHDLPVAYIGGETGGPNWFAVADVVRQYLERTAGKRWKIDPPRKLSAGDAVGYDSFVPGLVVETSRIPSLAGMKDLELRRFCFKYLPPAPGQPDSFTLGEAMKVVRSGAQLIVSFDERIVERQLLAAFQRALERKKWTGGRGVMVERRPPLRSR